MPKRLAPIKVPAELRDVDAQQQYRDAMRAWKLDSKDRERLLQACYALQRSNDFRRQIDEDGAILTDPTTGKRMLHPGVTPERQYRQQFSTLLREIGLDHEAEAPRAPQIKGLHYAS